MITFAEGAAGDDKGARDCCAGNYGASKEGSGVDASTASTIWQLKRNCALSPRQVVRFYLTLVGISVFIATGFAAFGAWMVLPFAGLEMVALGAALLVYARHSTDRENVVLDRRGLVVETVVAGRRTVTSLNPYWVQVVVDTGSSTMRSVGGAVLLMEQGKRIPVGRFVDARERRLFAHQLRHALAAARAI